MVGFWSVGSEAKWHRDITYTIVCYALVDADQLTTEFSDLALQHFSTDLFT